MSSLRRLIVTGSSGPWLGLITLAAAGGCATGVLSPGPEQDPGVDGGMVDPFVPLPDAGPQPDGGPDGGTGGVDAGPRTCDELACGPTERCVPGPGGAGVVCEDISCDDDLDCAADEHCNGTICAPDTCTAGVSRCVGEAVEVCAPNGSDYEALYACGSDAYFESSCTVEAGAAGCPCEDDWDCPAFTACEAGTCTGTGEEPTCLLDPLSFEEVLPSLETGFPWGGTGIGEEEAVGSPYPSSAQVVMPPMVANLDDDNADGVIDELDFPEIIFTSFCDRDFQTNGVLRAIHGGGPNKGGDYFATCADEVWNEGDDPDALTCTCNQADVNSTASLAVGDLDGDGRPEIVAVTEGPSRDQGELRIYDNRGNRLAQSPTRNFTEENPSPTLANLDFAGPAEIIIGRQVFTLSIDEDGVWSFVDFFEGSGTSGRASQGPIACVADLVGDGRPEIVGGGTVYQFPRPPAGVSRRSECPADLDVLTEEERSFCNGQLLTVWSAQTENPDLSTSRTDGYCAIADVLGENRLDPTDWENPLDGVPEVITVDGGWVQVFDGQSGLLLFEQNLNAGDRGGPPNVDDFDGDGFPEVATAAATAYVVVDFQAPTESDGACPTWPNTLSADTGIGSNPARTPPSTSCTINDDCGNTQVFSCNQQTNSCVCLHNGWRRTSEDGSSRVTGSSVFDFNGDGRAEVVYNDECFFRVFDGLDGRVWFAERAPSRTRTEYPVIADVDNDGNAEIVFATSNESGFCNNPSGAGGNDFNNGIEVWGDDADTWVPARRIWNQHAYHVTNVLESGGLPIRAPESWREFAGRSYNVYRSNPRTFGVAPDLVVENVNISSPDAACGALGSVLDITARVANQGDVRVGPGVIVAFYGEWDGPPAIDEALEDADGDPLVIPLDTSLEPGGEILLTAQWEVAFNDAGILPDRIRVVADDGAGIGAARECVEDNNDFTGDVVAGAAAADLEVTLGTVDEDDCPDPTVEVTVTNSGVVAASDIRVELFAGNPFAGGTFLTAETVAGPLAPGEDITFTATLDTFVGGRLVTVWAWVNPDRTVPECAEGNNTDAADPAECPTILR